MSSNVSPSSEQKYGRDSWRAACRFQPHSCSGVLQEVLTQIQMFSSSVLLLDLDSTLYEVSPRSFQILQQWSQSGESRAFPSHQSAFSRMQLSQVGYSLEDTFQALGLSLSDSHSLQALERLKKFWRDRFFTNDYLQYDRAYQGAADFVGKAHESGAEIVYLTGRDVPGMRLGTVQNLLRDGFPWEQPRTHLLMKPHFQMDDLEYKKQASQFVHQKGRLVASFENEPPNVVALSELFPQSMHVFVDTVCSPHQTEARHGLYRIKSYPSDLRAQS